MSRLLLLPLVLVLLASCAINRKPLRQSTVPLEEMDPGVQAQVARGEVDIGYTAEMVQRALGEPATIEAKASGNSVVATWSYPDYQGLPLQLTFRHGVVSEISRDN